MLRYIVFLALALIALVLETTLLANWPTQALRFDLLWIMILYVGFSTPLLPGTAIVLTLGFLTDVTAAPYIGLYAAVFFLFFVLLRTFIAHMFVETLWARLLWVGILSVAASAVEWGLLVAMGEVNGIQFFVFRYVLLQSLMNMFVAAFFFTVLDFTDSFLAKNNYDT